MQYAKSAQSQYSATLAAMRRTRTAYLVAQRATHYSVAACQALDTAVTEIDKEISTLAALAAVAAVL